jgi:hypothetical protein
MLWREVKERREGVSEPVLYSNYFHIPLNTQASDVTYNSVVESRLGEIDEVTAIEKEM